MVFISQNHILYTTKSFLISFQHHGHWGSSIFSNFSKFSSYVMVTFYSKIDSTGVVTIRRNVKRLSSLIDATRSNAATNQVPPPPPLPPIPSPRRQLHPAIREAIERYRTSQLRQVIPSVNVMLPDQKSEEGREGRGRNILIGFALYNYHYE